ncbi:zinc finger domain-containing protein, LSD1 subclass [Desulfitobacterium chlororespirans DSM 11544]|uniref:Zinc finger domain-containing protein, LSD1 subclass n=2 Tax=Desulfitobacterium chlororespirans TaxID=51616 RepID=A0A1M7TZV5_9FIRM|nr:zinc finger domain-containing protein, LSD1 subclass [Desulfitobacterium chlororespirans DSM 11544]
MLSESARKEEDAPMCFRPAAVSKVIICSGCQKKLTLQQGHMAAKCPFCGTEIGKEEVRNPQPPNHTER